MKIRLQRTGRTNDPSFRVVVVEHTESTKTGSIVEQVGTYSPKTKVKNLIADRIKYWLSVGAKASGTVHNMLVSAGIVTGKKVNVLPKKSLPVAQGTAQAGPPESAAPEGTPEVKDGEQKTANSEQQNLTEAKVEEPATEASTEVIASEEKAAA